MFRLAQLQRKIERLNEHAKAMAKQMRADNKPDDDVQTEALKIYVQVRAVQKEIQKYKTDQLLKLADHLGLPTPPYGDEEAWELDENKISHHLRLKAQTQLRKDIRQEQKERREMWTMVVKDIIAPIGGIIISVLSLLIAYAALKLKH